jgi:cytochrome c oxidase subunit III
MSHHQVDVSELPTTAFGSRDVVWWGTMGFVVIEGFSLALCIMATLYLRRNFPSWPPLRTPRPDLLIPTINTILLLALIIPMMLVDRAARVQDLRRVQRGLLAATVLSLIITVLRGFEFAALNTRWDSNAYGSIQWATLGFHATLIVGDLLESATLCALMFVAEVKPKHFVDASNNAAYTYFLAASWLPLYVVIFLWPGL